MSDGRIRVAQHLCLTEQGCCVVPETSIHARWLKWPAGTMVPKDEFDALAGHCDQHSPAPQKARTPAHNKARTPRNNK